MPKIEDYLKDGMTHEERTEALEAFAMKCQEEHEQVPMWVRMQLEPDETITVPLDLKKALDDIDKEFGVKK